VVASRRSTALCHCPERRHNEPGHGDRAGAVPRRRVLRNSGRFSLVDITPIAREAQTSNLQACGGCDMRLAQRIGAELAITGTVQKVSNLILNMNIYVRDASTGLIRANPLLTYAQKPRTETEEKTCSSERAKQTIG
jgi:hypothetical protein